MEHLHNLDINRYKRVHFIGIGGISMSGLAQILLHKGHDVSGSDANPSEITKKLIKQGCNVFNEHSPNNLISPDLVIYTAAIAKIIPNCLRLCLYPSLSLNALFF